MIFWCQVKNAKRSCFHCTYHPRKRMHYSSKTEKIKYIHMNLSCGYYIFSSIIYMQKYFIEASLHIYLIWSLQSILLDSYYSWHLKEPLHRFIQSKLLCRFIYLDVFGKQQRGQWQQPFVICTMLMKLGSNHMEYSMYCTPITFLTCNTIIEQSI